MEERKVLTMEEAVEVEHALKAARERIAELTAAMDRIIRWCKPSLKKYQPSIALQGCVTPTAEACLAENVINIAQAALQGKPQ